MRIYVAHSTSFDFRSELYEPLKKLSEGHTFVFPHEDDTFTHSKKIISTYDLVLAEVSHPSTGLGIELGWADYSNVPVVCLHKEGAKRSSSLDAVCRTFIEYSSPKDIPTKIESHLRPINT